MEKAAIASDDPTNVFVQDPDFAWLPATVVDTDDADRVQVQIQLPPDWTQTTLLPPKAVVIDKTVRWVNLNDYFDHVLPQQNNKAVRDMAELPHLHEAGLLYQIKERHAMQQPYTRVGDILVAVNPCQWMEGLYTVEMQELYAKHFVGRHASGDIKDTTVEEKKDDSVVATSSTSFESFYDRLGHEPHLYEVSASAYRGLSIDRQDQTILVSGESGAGKTETVKLILRHLSTINRSALGDADTMAGADKPTETMVNYVVQSSPVFEAFGNAKTCSNNNSSRFGKVTRMHFAPSNTGTLSLTGSSFVSYLLETSRVVYHSPGERCFHIFYQILAASEAFKTENLGEEWTNATAADFRYLGEAVAIDMPQVPYANDWEATLYALNFFQWQAETMAALVKCLGTILRLGNLSFHEVSEGEAVIDSRGELELLSKIIGIPEDVIEQAMTRRSLKTRQDDLSVPLSCETAKEGCDALAKKIYSRVFSSIVAAINAQTASSGCGDESGTVSLLDIFGFERFKVNRFEQLCINYTNEKLQNKYVQDNLQRHKIEYEREGLQLFDMKLFDNSDILELLEGNNGLINALSEESLLPNGNNASFVFKLKTRHKDHERLIDEKLHMKTEFGIRHFAGPVIYDASEFVERNFDKLPDALLQLATQSSNPLLAREFRELVSQQQDEDAHETARKSKMTTVMERFRFQLRVLMDELSDTQVRYIRCIKPNDTLVPKVFDHVTVLRQLKCAGLITAIEITRETFPNKLPFKAVEDRFKCLLGPKKLAMMNSMEQDDKCQFMMSALFAPEIEKFNTSRFTMPYTCGKTKVFYRAGSLEFLETLRQTYLTAKAEQLQRWARMTVAVRSYRKTSRALGVIQGWGRIIGAKAELKRRRRAVVTIQSLARCWLQKAHYKQKLAHAKRLVAAGRRLLVRIRIQRRRSLANLKERSATKLSAWIRSRRALRQYRQTVRCTRMLQSSFRAKKAVECLLIRKGAALCIEDWYGRAKARQSSYGDEKAAAIRQASAVSCEIQVHPEEGAHMSPDDAATMVQSAARTKGDIRKGAATIMQTWIRGRTKRTNYIGLKRSILCLQDRYMLKKALGHEFTAHALHGVPKVVEYVNESVDDLNTISNESDAIASKEQVQFVNKSENLIEERLTKELNEEKLKVLSLERDIAMMSSEAELHAQDMEADFDERLVGYEEEVLILKQTIAQLEDGRVKAEKEMAATDEAHKKSIQRLQFEIQKIQSSHRDYLGKIMELLDDTEAAQNLQTSRIREEMEVVKRERDKQVSSLKEEIKLLRSIGFGSKKKGISLSEKAQRLSRKLYAELSADNVLLVVKEAQQQPHSPPQPYIEVNLSSKVRNMISYLEEIVSMAEYEVADLHARSDTLQQHLVYAYEEVEYARGGRQAY